MINQQIREISFSQLPNNSFELSYAGILQEFSLVNQFGVLDIRGNLNYALSIFKQSFYEGASNHNPLLSVPNIDKDSKTLLEKKLDEAFDVKPIDFSKYFKGFI
jgi:hypothetical protein